MTRFSISSESTERISALSDGQLPQDQLAATLEALLAEPDAKQAWLTYHVVGDVLRSAELAPTPSDLDFLERFEQRWALENGPGSVRTHGVGGIGDMGRSADHGTGFGAQQSANAGVFRWRWVAAVACTVLAGVVGLGLSWDTSDARQASVVPAPENTQTLWVSSEAQGVMVRDARLDELLAAHRQQGGHSVLQMPAGFLRNATYDGAAR